MDNFLKDITTQYADKIRNPQTKWNLNHTQMDFSIEVMGLKTNGHVYLKDGLVTLEGKVPLMARMFSGKIEEVIREKIEDLLS